MSRKRLSLRITIVGILLVVALTSVVLTTIVAASLARGKFGTARASASLILPVASVLDTLAFHKIPDLAVWKNVLALTIDIDSFQKEIKAQLGSAESETLFSISPLVPGLKNISNNVNLIASDIPKTFLVSYALNQDTQIKIVQASQILTDALAALEPLTSGQKRLLILLQNNDELRAGGGFMGSYVLITMNDGDVLEYKVEDIYDADGQFDGFIPAPPGVKEYLSSNRGLRLPDANWDADFSYASQEVLKYFALGDRQNIHLVAAVTLDLGKAILGVTGPIDLPDYDMQVSSENITDVLQTHRESFFPGSIQKKQMLAHLLTMLRLRVQTLDATTLRSLAETALAGFTQKSIMFYSPDPAIQDVIEKNIIGGTLPKKDEQNNFLYLLESNVGINKANAEVERSVTVEIEGFRARVKVLLSNANEPLNSASSSASPSAEHRAYVNYQRILVPSTWKLQEVTFDSQLVSFWNEAILSRQEQTFKEIGMLLVVKEKDTKQLTYEFVLPIKDGEPKSLFVIKQPGLPPTPYSFTLNGHSQSLILDSDILLK